MEVRGHHAYGVLMTSARRVASEAGKQSRQRALITVLLTKMTGKFSLVLTKGVVANNVTV